MILFDGRCNQTPMLGIALSRADRELLAAGKPISADVAGAQYVIVLAAETPAEITQGLLEASMLRQTLVGRAPPPVAKPPPSKGERRAARYAYRARITRWPCAASLWTFRRRLLKYGFGPRQLKGKRSGELFRLLHEHGGRYGGPS